MQFAQTSVEVFEVTDAKGGCHSIEAAIFERELQAVFAAKMDDISQTFALHLLSSHGHHSFGDVCPHEPFGP